MHIVSIFIICLPSYPVDITHGINFSYTIAMTSQWIISHTVEMTLGSIASKRLHKIVKFRMVLLHGIKRISHGLWLDMTFTQWVVCFLFPSLGEVQPQTMGDPVIIAGLFVWGFSGVFHPKKNFSLIWRRHYYLVGLQIWPICSALMAIEQFFKVPNLLWYGSTLNNAYPWHSHLLPSVWQWSCNYQF